MRREELGLRSRRRGMGGGMAVCDDHVAVLSCTYCPSDLRGQRRSTKGIQTVVPGARLLASRTLPKPRRPNTAGIPSPGRVVSRRDGSLCCGAVPSETSLCFRSPPGLRGRAIVSGQTTSSKTASISTPVRRGRGGGIHVPAAGATGTGSRRSPGAL